MHRRIALTLGAAAGGLAAAAFLPVAVAFADHPSPDGPDAFTFGGLTYDPFVVVDRGMSTLEEGWGDVRVLFSAAPWFSMGMVAPEAKDALALAPDLTRAGPGGQGFEVYNADGTELGTANGSVYTMNILGIFQNTQVTIEEFDPATQRVADGASDLQVPPTDGLFPPVGSVYDVTEFLGITNIYWAIPGLDGGTDINDVLDLFGWKIPLLINFDATDPFDVGAGFAGIDVGGDVGSAAASGASDPLAFLGL